jgi:alkylation response protein AidB-like acyl-CoA dehydrogenase
MTIETRPATGSGIDYAAFEGAIGLNWYDVDPNLRQIVERIVPADEREFVERHLRNMGGVIGERVAARAEVTDKNPPRLEKFDRWGNEVNEIVHHPGALETKRDLWENGFIGLRWSKEMRERTPQAAMVVHTGFSYFLNQAETGMACAIGMTSSAAGVIDRNAPAEIRERFLPHLTTMDYDQAWDGAMFMTELRGGSDLGQSECAATKTADGWRVSGAKWFCSNVDAEAIMILARPEGGAPGVKGLASFLVPKHRADGSRNGIHIRRLKDKLGTKAVPTGEVDFEDAEAYLMGGEKSEENARDGRGINRMMDMVQGSRFGVAMMGLGIMRRSFLDATIYAFHREAFGQPIAEYPLVRETLADMAVEVEAGCAIAFEAGEMGTRRDDESRRLYRILVPLAKLRCARRGVEMASQAVEMLGGNGYIENWPTARQLRDAQCHTIWEGTENIICLDVLRSMRKEHAEEALFARVDRALAGAEHPALAEAGSQLGRSADELREAVAYLERAGEDERLLQARRLTEYMADVAQAALLLDEASWELAHKDSARKAVVARRFIDRRLRERPLRGITSGDRTVLDHFDAIVRYQPVARDAV